MKTSRRNVLMSTLFGTGYVGLRALATGIPAAALLRGRRAFADAAPTCGNKSKARFIIMHTSGNGDPINANCPGTYEDTKISHPQPWMTPVTMSLGGVQTKAAAPWAGLPQTILDRTTFWHIMTNTPVHPQEPDVLKLKGATTPDEMLPSLLAKQLAPCLGTVQSQPMSIGATSPSEGLTFNGAALPIIPPLALKATLAAQAGPLTNLQAIRDDTLSKISDIYRGHATTAQAKYLDAVVASQSQIRNLNQSLLTQLDSITNKTDPVAAQITAALVLIQMNVTPVISIHIPFGGDNHFDKALAGEVTQTTSGVASIGSLISQIDSMGYTDKVTFMSLDVFGRTLGPSYIDGRTHNPNHQVSITIGTNYKPGIVGGVGQVQNDYGAIAINSSTGAGGSGGDIAAGDTLASFGKTVLASVGVDQTVIDTAVVSGKVVTGMLA
jgi:hypothetical protein